MYRLLVVDDEAIIRNGLDQKVHWNEYGFNCVGTYAHGKEALKVFEEGNLDVIITDINMPIMNGLELAQIVAEKDPMCKIVLLTGYDDFDYAQKAVKLNVVDYVLKPITIKEMHKLLEKLKNMLDQERSAISEREKIQKLLIENTTVLKEHFLNQLVRSNIIYKEQELIEKLQYFSINPILDAMDCNGLFTTIVFDAQEKYWQQNDTIQKRTSTSDQTRLQYFALYNIVSELLEKSQRGVAFQNNAEQTIAILIHAQQNEEILTEEAKSFAQNIVDIMNEKLDFGVIASIGDCVENIHDIRTSYRSAKNMIDYHFFIGNQPILIAQDLPVSWQKKSMSQGLQQKEDALVQQIKTGQKSNQKPIEFVEYFDELRQAHFSIEEVYILIQRLLLRVEQIVFELDIDQNLLIQDGKNIILNIYQYRTLYDIEEWLYTLYGKIIHNIAMKRENYSENLMKQAQKYIEGNFMKADISVHDVSQTLCLSASHFSNLFKNNTGETFTEYLTSVRMQHAKKLLINTTLKTYEIAYQTGFNDPHYFSMVFKKNVGMTPTQFREES